MGEIAEMMLDGTLCGVCGDYLGEEEWGFPRYCPGCGPDLTEVPPEPKKKKVKCKHCKKSVTPNGMSNHVQDVHQKPDWWPNKRNHPTYGKKRILK